MGNVSTTVRVLAAVPVLMGAALLATVLSGFSHVRTLRATLLRGQADLILEQARRGVPSGTGWSDDVAEQLLAQLQQSGVVCLAIFDESATPFVVAGDCGSPDELREALLTTGSGEVVDLGSRVRTVRRRSLRRPGRGPTAEQLAAAGLRPPPPPVLVEFEPRQTQELEASARRTLVIGGAASLALFVAGIVVWRLTVRAERLQEQQERQRRLAALGEMAAVLSHEIRNPLAAIKGQAQLLAERLDPQTREGEKATRLVKGSLRLERLTDDLLSMVRSQSVERVAVDPTALLREAAASLEESDVELELEGAPESWPLDPDQIHRVLVNLLRNAVQASPDEHPPVARVGLEGADLVYEVRDFGEGIREGEKAQIFEPFHTTRVTGTGLGLAVARRIAELHGGSVTAGNHPEGGAVFRLRIPRG
jgi:two-component system sensor histidine kinase HydH